MKVHGFWDGAATGLIRVCQPLDALRAFGGHEITTACGWENGRDNAMRSDIVVGERFDKTEALPLWRSLRAGRARLVYEIDDDMWNVDESNMQAARLRRSSVKAAVESAIEIADAVTVSTEPIAETVSQFNRNVHLTPNCIEERLLRIERPHRDKVVVGWSGGSSHAKDLALVHRTLRRLLHQHPEAEFHNVGTNFLPLMRVPGRHSDWHTNLWTYYSRIDFDIALAPLARIPFNRSKSGIRVMEAAALGIPVIASNMKPYQDVIVHGETGFLVTQEHEWMKYLRILVKDRSLREQMGAAAKERAQAWTFERNWRTWESVYEGLLAKRVSVA